MKAESETLLSRISAGSMGALVAALAENGQLSDKDRQMLAELRRGSLSRKAVIENDEGCSDGADRQRHRLCGAFRIDASGEKTADEKDIPPCCNTLFGRL